MSDNRKFFWSVFWIAISILFLFVGMANAQRPQMPTSKPSKTNFEKAYKKHAIREIPNLYIVYDDEFNSRLLKNELTRNWSSYHKSLLKYDEIRDKIPVKNIVFIHYHDTEKIQKYKIKGSFIKYPVYRFGEVGKAQHFPEKTFSCSTWPLVTSLVLANKYTEAYRQWKGAKSYVKWATNWRNHIYSIEFVYNNDLQHEEGIVTLFCSACCDDDCNCSDEYKYVTDVNVEMLKKIPGYNPETYHIPEPPIMKFPWEKRWK